MPKQKFTVRRMFLHDEMSAAKRLQLSIPEFERHFPRHARWLDEAVRDVLEGERMAFGVYAVRFDDMGRPIVDLVGCTIFKRQSFGDSIDLKSFAITESSRKGGAGKALFDAVEDYCIRAGAGGIDLQIPCNDPETVSFFHKRGLRVVDMRRSPYRRGDYLYRMHKPLVQTFNGDPFDLFAFGTWLVEHVCSFKNVRTEIPERLIRFDLSSVKMREGEVGFSIPGAALVIDQRGLEVGFTLAPGADAANLVLAISDTDIEPTRIRSPELKVVDIRKFHEQHPDSFSQRRPSFERKNISGMVTTVVPDLFDRVNALNADAFAFFKTGPIGKYLKAGDKLAMFSERTPSSPIGGVTGLAEIVRVVCGTPSEVWSRLDNVPSVFSEAEYARFSNGKSDIVGLQLRKFHRVEVLDLETLAAQVFKVKIEDLDVTHGYMSTEIVDRLDAIVRPIGRKRSSIRWDLFLSHAGDDTPIAERLYKLLKTDLEVFLDTKCLVPGDDWAKKLVEAQAASLVTVVLISDRTGEAHYEREEVASAIELFRKDERTHRVVPVFITSGTGMPPTPFGLKALHAIQTSSESLETTATQIREVVDLMLNRA